MLFISSISIAQNLPTDVWGIRNVVRNSDNEQVSVYLSRSSEDLCLDGFTISAPTRYVRIPSSGDNIVGVGTDLNSLTNYTVLGSFAPQPQGGAYTGSGQNRSRTTTTANTCVNRVTGIRNVRFSGGGDGHEFLSFNYSATEAGRFRVWIVDVGSGNDVPVRLVSFGDYYEFDGGASRPISITVPERELGNAYEIRMAAVSDLDLAIVQETPIIGGTRITNINSSRIEFITASNDLGADDIWLDRFHRGDSPSRSRGRFKTGARLVEERVGGKIREYVVTFGSTELYTYEGIQVNAQRGAQSNRHDRALNGPTIEYTWRNAGARDNDDAWINIQWRVNLPPGWRESGLSNYQIRIYSRDNGVNRIHLNNAADSRSEFLSGNNTWGSGITHRYADNDWELGVGVDYNGRTYRIKIVDNVGHGEHNGGNRPRNGDRTGGVTNSIGGVPINRDHSGTSSTHGGHRPGSINFNDGW